MENLSKGVYFIYAPNQNKVKIGRSNKIERRYKQLRTGFMDKGILLIGILAENENQLENELHNKFAHLRDNGEWFFLTKELENYILNIKYEHERFIEYGSLKTLQNKLSYQSLGMFRFITFLKQMQNKIMIPLILSIVGLVIAFYNFKFESTNSENQLTKLLSYSYFILFPIATPYVSKRIIEYNSVITGIFYYLLLFATLSIEFINLMIALPHLILLISRITILSIYISFTKYILIRIKVAQEEESQLVKIKHEINENKSVTYLKELKSDIISKHDKKISILKYFTNTISGIIFLLLNILLLFISDSIIAYRIVNLIIIDLAILIWFLFRLIVRYSKNSESRIEKFKLYIIPVFLFISFYSTLGLFKDINLFWEMNSIIIFGLLPFSIGDYFITKKINHYKVQIKEINKILKK